MPCHWLNLIWNFKIPKHNQVSRRGVHIDLSESAHVVKRGSYVSERGAVLKISVSDRNISLKAEWVFQACN